LLQAFFNISFPPQGATYAIVWTRSEK